MEQNNNGQNYYASPAVEEHKRRATTPLVLGIISCVVLWYPIACIAGIICGAIGLKQSMDNRKFAITNNLVECGQNKGAFVTSLIGLILSILITLFYVVVFALAGWALSVFFENGGVTTFNSILSMIG